MNVRQLTKSERFDASLVSRIAFHMRIDDPEKEREACERSTVEDWGAFADDGTLMARIVNNRYVVHLNEHLVRCGGIGAVSTLPEYRESGAIRSIFASLLPNAYQNGEILSALYPFNHAFYRKFGYETAGFAVKYSFAPQVLSGYRFHGDAERCRGWAEVLRCHGVYEAFAEGFNLSATRTTEVFEERFAGDVHRSGCFTYLLSEDRVPLAYVTFKDGAEKPEAVMHVLDYAWVGREGFEALLGFLARFSADYGKICITLPSAIRLENLILSPLSYDITAEPVWDFMVRVINVPGALCTLPVLSEDVLTIRTADEWIPENNGTWRLEKGVWEQTNEAPDITLDVRALGQMVTGAVSFDEALLRRDVDVSSNEQLLRRLFVRRPFWVSEHF